jgi:hypothetical protein
MPSANSRINQNSKIPNLPNVTLRGTYLTGLLRHILLLYTEFFVLTGLLEHTVYRVFLY